MARKFITQREINFIDRVNKELIQKVVGQEVTYYAISVEKSRVNRLYEEAIQKVWDPPVLIDARVLWDNTNSTSTGMGIDSKYPLEVYFHDLELRDRNVKPKEGDFIEFGQVFFEITSVTQPQIVFGQVNNRIMTKCVCVPSREGQFHAGGDFSAGTDVTHPIENTKHIFDDGGVDFVFPPEPPPPEPDTTPPTFAGIDSLEVDPSDPSGSLFIGWDSATDDESAPEDIVYNIYLSLTSGGQDFDSDPAIVTGPGIFGVTSFAGFDPDTEYFVVVRAEDEAGNEDTNVVELSVTTDAAPVVDVTPPVFDGLTSASAESGTEIHVTWDLAVDDVTADVDLFYDLFVSLTPGGQDFDTPAFSLTGFAAPGPFDAVVGSFDPDTTYYLVMRCRDEAGNSDTNTNEFTATTPEADVTAPTFGGLTFAQGLNSSQVSFAWTNGTDDVDPITALVYDLYVSSTSGGQDFLSPPYISLGPFGVAGPYGSSIGSLAAGTDYYLVMRCRDSSGNRDTNTVEFLATTDP